ncbi:response regulator [Xanthobacter sp. 126]|uniref:response regulator n=1 Tax=Xanthobacter sp. 126 TaxID=1131814 RepID=UPI00045EA330|nr:response regulator [Xanthobacter sp. 126]
MRDVAVIVVDDDKEFLLEVREGLALENLPVVCASSPLSALDIVEQNFAIRVLVTDLAMPGLDGLELIRRVGELRQGAQILPIILTGNASLENAIAALRMGAVDFLQKPVEIADLVAAIRRALDLSVQKRRAATLLDDPLALLRLLDGLRMDRKRVLPRVAGGDAAWEMLLDLAMAQAAGRQVSVSALCAGAGTSATTALRRLEALEQEGLVERHPDPEDRRRVWLQLTHKGGASVRQAGRRFAETLRALIW